MTILLEPMLKVILFIVSYMWAKKIMYFRNDRQIVVNPILILLAATLILLPSEIHTPELFGISTQTIRIALYLIYISIASFGLFALKTKDVIF